MARWLARVAMGVGLLALCGCSALDILDIVDDIGGGGNDGNDGATVSLLSDNWTVTGYTGVETGAVTVPTSATMRWRLRSDGTFTVTSAAPVSTGGETTRTYDEAGTWRVVSGATATLGFTFTRLAGTEVATADRREVAAQYARPDQHQLVLTTGAIGPGSVRYVLYR